MALRRELLSSESIERVEAGFRAAGIEVLGAAERRASLLPVLERVAGRDVWVFGYGSLMWNPAFEHAETRRARSFGWHRSFCLWNTFGRGTPDAPGLTLALERGGSCAGVALRIPAAQVESELGVLWNREMLTGSYVPRFVALDSAGEPLEAVTFVANRAHPRYTGRLSLAEIARYMAHARGPLGACREYLESTVAELARMGIRDGSMHTLLRAVQALG